MPLIKMFPVIAKLGGDLGEEPLICIYILLFCIVSHLHHKPVLPGKLPQRGYKVV